MRKHSLPTLFPACGLKAFVLHVREEKAGEISSGEKEFFPADAAAKHKEQISAGVKGKNKEERISLPVSGELWLPGLGCWSLLLMQQEKEERKERRR